MAEPVRNQAAAAPTLVALGEEFRAASDAKLRKVTQLIDRMPERGAADALLAPVRDRLAALRPARTMNRNRLLFTPFDLVLVPPARWQPGGSCLPRSLLGPVIALLDGPEGVVLPPPPPFDAADPAELSRCGRPLWAAAAIVLSDAPIPAAWCTTDWERAVGIPVAIVRDMLPVMALVFRSAYAIRTLPSPSQPSLEPAVLSMLTAAARSGPIGWGVMLTLILDVVPADLVTRLAATVARGDRLAMLLRTGLDQAVAQMLGRLERLAQAPVETVPADEPATLLLRLGTMQRLAGLREMENRPGFEQKRVARLEHLLDDANRSMFQRSLRSQLGRFEAMMANQENQADDAQTVLSIEADARRLRAFAAGAAALEGGRDYQRMIDEAITGVATDMAGPSAVARLRLVELLGGSDKAVRMARSMGGAAGFGSDRASGGAS